MEILCIVSGILFLLYFIKYSIYRRQIRDICRQMVLLRERDTNQRIQTDLVKSEVLELAGQINALYDIQLEKEISLQKKERQLQNTLTNISHDIRTPLTSLKGYFELLLEEEEEGKRQKDIAVIRKRIADLTELLEELFTYAKLQNEGYELEMKKQDFTKIVLECLFSFHEQLQEKQIEPVMHVREQSLEIYCNDVAVKRVISNIIRNALLHGNGHVEIGYEIREQGAYFFCKNEVENVEDIDIRQVFERFYKADAARSNVSSGLGLSIARELVEKMGGKMAAHIEETCFVAEVWLG